MYVILYHNYKLKYQGFFIISIMYTKYIIQNLYQIFISYFAQNLYAFYIKGEFGFFVAFKIGVKYYRYYTVRFCDVLPFCCLKKVSTLV